MPSNPPQAPLHSAPHPLTVRLCNWIGDVVMALPALELLEQHGFNLNLYGKGWARILLSGYDWHFTRRQDNALRDRLKDLRAIRLQSLHLDPTFDRRINALSFPNSFSSALELRLSGHKVCGYSKDGRSLLLSKRLERLQDKHVLITFWHLACELTGRHEVPPPANIGFKLSQSAQDKALALLAQHQLDGKPFACVVPFATGMMYKFDKKWPYFKELTQSLSKELPIVICPGPGEEAEAEQFGQQATILPGVPLDVYAAILARTSLTLANDTGPGHLAAAVGTPLISILGPTDPEHWAPWGTNVTVVREWPQWPSASTVHNTALRLLPS